MNALTNEEKLKKILELVKKHTITAYEIAKNTTITEAGIGKILNNLVKKPHSNSLNKIYNYVITYEKDHNLNKTKGILTFTKDADIQYNVTTNTWKKMLIEINVIIENINKEKPSIDKIQRLRKAELTKLELLQDLEDLNK